VAAAPASYQAYLALYEMDGEVEIERRMHCRAVITAARAARRFRPLTLTTERRASAPDAYEAFLQCPCGGYRSK
jgi:hypothetical protein